MGETKNLKLSITEGDMNFIDWRNKINGQTESDMQKIDTAYGELYENKCNKSIVEKTILPVSEWQQDSSGGFTLTYNNENIKSTSIVELLPDTSAGSENLGEQIKALQRANIIDGGQTDGSITFRIISGIGTLPSFDLPVTIIIRGDT